MKADEKPRKDKVECNTCKVEFEINQVQKPMLQDFIDIGLQCPNGHFFHSFYDHPKLEKRRLKLRKIKAGINKSLKHHNWFLAETERYKQYFNQMQIDGSSASRT